MKMIALNYLKNLRHVAIEITGEDLLNLGIPQGKIYKEIFDYVLKAKLENTNLSKDAELVLVKEMNF